MKKLRNELGSKSKDELVELLVFQMERNRSIDAENLKLRKIDEVENGVLKRFKL